MEDSVAEIQRRAAILAEALPYIKEFAGRRILVKIGGELLDNQDVALGLARDLGFLRAVGIDVVVVHGGGPQISRAMKRFGKEPLFIKGRRQTDSETLELMATTLLGDINRKFVALLNTTGTKAIGLSGADDTLLLVEQEDPEFGFVGTVRKVNSAPIDSLLQHGYLPVVAGIGVDSEGQFYNINADAAAGKVAVAISAIKFILLTNVAGLYRKFGEEGSFISEIDPHGLIHLLSTGDLNEGILPKVESVLSAVKGGVPRAHILDGRLSHSLLLEIFTKEGIGTMVRDKNGGL